MLRKIIFNLISWVTFLPQEFKRFGSLKFNPNWSFWRNFVGRISWVLSVGRNALVVVVATILCYILYINGNQPFKLVGKYFYT